MSGDFLDHLAQSVGPADAPVLRPRPASRFESVTPPTSNLPLLDVLEPIEQVEPTETNETGQMQQPMREDRQLLPTDAVESERASSTLVPVLAPASTVPGSDSQAIDRSHQHATTPSRWQFASKSEFPLDSRPPAVLHPKPPAPQDPDPSLSGRLDQLAFQLRRVINQIEEPSAPFAVQDFRAPVGPQRSETVLRTVQQIEHVREIRSTTVQPTERFAAEIGRTSEIVAPKKIATPAPDVVVERQPQPIVLRQEVVQPKPRKNNSAQLPVTQLVREKSPSGERVAQPQIQPQQASPTVPQISVERPQPAAASERIVNVTIGRIEVRAIQKSNPVQVVRVKRPTPSVMTLNDYLRRRAGGRT